MSAPPALEIQRLTVSYGRRTVLWNVNAGFPQGVLAAIVGPNGAGKSTLLRASLGLVPADAGKALILGRPARSALDRVAYVPQGDSVDWDFPITVREVVEMGRYQAVGWVRRVPAKDRVIVDECLERVGMLDLGRRQIGQLSTGQRQRCFIARALARRAPIMLMDEPFSGVDARTQAGLVDLLRELQRAGNSIVVVHHDLGMVRETFDWSLLLNVGTVACGPVSETLAPEMLRRAFRERPAPVDSDDLEWPWAG